MTEVVQGYLEGELRYFLVDRSADATLLLGNPLTGWDDLKRHSIVTVSNGRSCPTVGLVDTVMPDGSAFWLVGQWDRRLITERTATQFGLWKAIKAPARRSARCSTSTS
ncbi:hypothetical protein QF038_002345 [Pseudarthrobacter sp. W1I19]|nr:hypothetical protein [Pseudarthrobacter sp. W1I19]